MQVNEYGFSPLIKAAELNAEKMTALLLAAGADANLARAEGR